MRRTRPVALLAAGSATASPLLRNAAVAGAIGPVKSTSLRVASRLVNALRGGHAVDSFDEFENCRLILGVAPDGSRQKLLRQLCTESGLDLSHKMLVLAGSDAPDSTTCGAIRAARVCEVPGFEGRWFAADGNREAAAELRRVLGRSARITILRPGAASAFEAAHSILNRVLLAVIAAAYDCLRGAAIPPGDVDALVERALERAARAWIRGKRKSWPGTLDHAEFERESAALAGADPRLAQWFRTSVTAAESYMTLPQRGQVHSHSESM